MARNKERTFAIPPGNTDEGAGPGRAEAEASENASCGSGIWPCCGQNPEAAGPENTSVAVGRRLLGRVIDGLGNPMDDKGPVSTEKEYPLYANPINPLLRQRVLIPLDVGIRAINSLHTVGCGQRIGIFAGPGVGKRVLMGMIARNNNADVNVIALIGENGRKLSQFIDNELGTEGLKKSVVVVSAADHLSRVRVRGAFVATTIAEFFRDQGLHVNLMMDSVTQLAVAQGEIGMALGESPTATGYPPSVFSMIARLLERAGTSEHGATITGFYSVLLERDEMNEPIADTVRSILDGYLVLTRRLADQNHYPAIDALRSTGNAMEEIAGLEHKHNAGRLKELLSAYRQAEDLIHMGDYAPDSDPAIERTSARIKAINEFLRQDAHETVNMESSLRQLDSLMSS